MLISATTQAGTPYFAATEAAVSPSPTLIGKPKSHNSIGSPRGIGYSIRTAGPSAATGRAATSTIFATTLSCKPEILGK